MKVLLVDQFGKTTGRDTLALAELINADKDISMEVYLSDITEIPIDRHYTVKISKGFSSAYEGSFANKAKNYLKALRELRKHIKENGYDIVHLQWFSLPWVEWIYVRQLRKFAKIIITVHDVIPFDHRPMEMKALNKIYDEAEALIMHTEPAKNLFEDTYKANTPIYVVTQGFCNKADYHRIGSLKAKAYFGIPEDAVVFLYFGTIRPSKGLDILIKAIHAAHKRNEKVFLLAGGALHRVNEEKYRSLVKEYLDETYAKVTFEFIPQREEQWYFSAADVLCLPYLEVTQSGVAQLGLMYELPIIATDVGEMNSVCRNGQNGFICKPENVRDLMEAIQKLAQNEHKRKVFSEESKRMGESEFSLNKKAERIIQVYKSGRIR